jgi:hypothetical protein
VNRGSVRVAIGDAIYPNGSGHRAAIALAASAHSAIATLLASMAESPLAESPFEDHPEDNRHT